MIHRPFLVLLMVRSRYQVLLPVRYMLSPVAHRFDAYLTCYDIDKRANGEATPMLVTTLLDICLSLPLG